MERVLYTLAFQRVHEGTASFSKEEVALFVAMTYRIPAEETLLAIDAAIVECGFTSWAEFKANLASNLLSTER